MYPSIISRNDLQIPSWCKMALGLLERGKRTLCYLFKVTNEPFHFNYITLLLKTNECRPLSPKEKTLKISWDQGRDTCRNKCRFFCNCFFAYFCQANLSLKYSNGSSDFYYLFKNYCQHSRILQKQSRRDGSIK